MELTNKKGVSILIDEGDYKKLRGVAWWLLSDSRRPNYKRVFCIGENNKTTTIGRLILEAPKHLLVDHINGDTLDNRRSNLRLCTRSQNSMNRKIHSHSAHKYKGIVYLKRRHSYIARLIKEGKRYRSRSSKTDREAAVAYNELALKHFGEYARLNAI